MEDKDNTPREISFLDTFFKLENFTMRPEHVLALHKNGPKTLQVYTSLKDAPINLNSDMELEDVTALLAQSQYDSHVYSNAVFKAFDAVHTTVTDES